MTSSKVTTPLPNRLLRFSLLSWSLPYVTDPLPGQASQGLARYFYGPSIGHGSAPLQGQNPQVLATFLGRRSFQANIFSKWYLFIVSELQCVGLLANVRCMYHCYVFCFIFLPAYEPELGSLLRKLLPWCHSFVVCFVLEEDFSMYWSLCCNQIIWLLFSSFNLVSAKFILSSNNHAQERKKIDLRDSQKWRHDLTYVSCCKYVHWIWW